MFSSTSDFTTIARPAYLALALALHSTLPQTAFGQTLIEQSPAQEQIATEQKPKWEFLVASGALIPTGPQRGAIKRANLTAAQLSYVVRSHFAVNATFGWARSGDVAAGGAPKLDIFTYDLGGEVRPAQWMAGHGVTFSPLAGLGAGARSYVSRNNDVDATHQFTPYVSAGGEFG